MTCKHCQAELPDNARFCPECGALQPMICPSCGAESRPGSKLCTACGKKLPMAEREDRLVYARKKKHPLRVVSLIALVLAALLFLAAAVLFLTKTLDSTKKDKDKESQFSSQELPDPDEPEETEDPAVTEPEELPVEVTPAEEDELPTGDEVPAEPDVPEEEPPVEEEPEETPEEDPQPEEESPAQNELDDNDDYILPFSSTRLLTDEDIQGLSAWQLKVARNEIYARHGRLFTTQELQDYFNSREWYQGTIAPENFTDAMLTDIELANVRFLKAAE